MRHLLLDVIPSLSNPYSNKVSESIQVKPHTQRLELHVRPIVPFWLQLLIGLLGVLWLLGLRYLIPHHTAPVNSVRLLGNAATVVSGSSDQTVQRWQVHDRPWTIDLTRLEHQLQIGNTGKPIRVIREIPANNNQIAAGLDDGEIQLWQVAPPKQLESFEENDRGL